MRLAGREKIRDGGSAVCVPSCLRSVGNSALRGELQRRRPPRVPAGRGKEGERGPDQREHKQRNGVVVVVAAVKYSAARGLSSLHRFAGGLGRRRGQQRAHVAGSAHHVQHPLPGRRVLLVAMRLVRRQPFLAELGTLLQGGQAARVKA